MSTLKTKRSNTKSRVHGSVRVARVVAESIGRLVEREKRRQARLGWVHRVADKATRSIGSAGMLGFHCVVFIAWVGYNSGYFPQFTPFDPYPFVFLICIVSLEAIVLSIMVLIAQNEMQTDADRRAELDLQINILTERETTMILRKLARIEEALKIAVDDDEKDAVDEMLEDTDPVDIEHSIEQIT